MQIQSTHFKRSTTPKRFTPPHHHNEAAPTEVIINDIAYIRRDVAENRPSAGSLDRAFKVGGTALIGGAVGALPLVGAASNLLAGSDSGPASGMIGMGGAVLNLAATVGLAATGSPVWMVAPAAAGAMAWGLGMNERLG